MKKAMAIVLLLVVTFALAEVKPVANLVLNSNLEADQMPLPPFGGLAGCRKPPQIKLSKIEWIESFDGKTASCSGNPTLIQEEPTPGQPLLKWQAIFRTGSTIDIVPDTPSVWCAVDDGYRALALRIQNFGRKNRVDSEFSFGMETMDSTSRYR